MELKKILAGNYTFIYNPLSTEVFVQQIGAEWEIEIYKHKHFLGSLEINDQGTLYIVEDLNLTLIKTEEFTIEVN